MKNSILIAALASLFLSMPLVLADDSHHSGDKKSATAMTDKDKQMRMEKMQEHMLKMHAQMHKIMEAKTPEERKQLMDEHMKMMKDGKHGMHGMKGHHHKCGKKEDGKTEGGTKTM